MDRPREDSWQLASQTLGFHCLSSGITALSCQLSIVLLCYIFIIFIATLKPVFWCAVTAWNRWPRSRHYHVTSTRLYHSDFELLVSDRALHLKMSHREAATPSTACSLWTIAFTLWADVIAAYVCCILSHCRSRWCVCKGKTPCQLCQIQFLAHLIAAFKPILQCLFRTLAIQSPLRVVFPSSLVLYSALYFHCTSRFT